MRARGTGVQVREDVELCPKKKHQNDETFDTQSAHLVVKKELRRRKLRGQGHRRKRNQVDNPIATKVRFETSKWAV
jgi:hypothetical protein